MKKYTFHAESVFWVIYVILVIAFIFLAVCAILQRNHVSTIPSNSISVGNPDTLSYHVESISEENGIIQVTGWAVQKGVLYPYFNYGIDKAALGTYAKMQIAFMSQKTEELLLFPTQLQNQPYSAASFVDGTEYPYSSFVALIPLKDIGESEDGHLAFCFYDPEGNRTVYFTEEKISDGRR